MRIRNLEWRGVAVWPPEWWPPEHNALIEENAVLREVRIQDSTVHKFIQVEIETPKGPFWGVILVEKPGQLQILNQKLKENIGSPLTEIGDLEIDLFPSLRKRGPMQVRPYRTARNIRQVSNKK